MSVYTDLIDAGVEVSNWQSDLYAPVNPTVRAILEKYPKQVRSTFRNQIDGKPWYEFPFAFDPFWEKRASTGKADLTLPTQATTGLHRRGTGT